jgi:hypothetical protein
MDAPGPVATPEGLARAREELFIAEGSDWFWWYGDDHSSDHDLEFDDLFRRHLRNVYRSLDKPVPEELYVTNITTEPPRTMAHPPVGLLTPTLDGEVTSYFEWVGAGELELSASAGSMHQVAPARRPVVTGIRYGFDAERLFVRVDLARRAQDVLVDKGEIRVSFFKPANHRLSVSGDGLRACRAELFERRGPEGWHPKTSARPSAAAAQILEMGVRLADLGVQPGDTVSFFVTLLQDGHALEQYPAHHPLDVQVPGADFAARLWSV